MPDPSLGSAWSHESYDAIQYLKARTPYPPTITRTMFDYHAQTHPEPEKGWSSALDIGCGPGQMSVHLATRFARVHGQDPSPNMLRLAESVKNMSAEQLADFRLPPVSDPDRIDYHEGKGEAPHLPAGEKVDFIMMASCIHWMDWSTLETCKANWTKWASLLQPGGTLVVTGGRAMIGPYTGPEGDRIKPLREFFLNFPSQYSHIDVFKTHNEKYDQLRQGGLYRNFPMPWEHDSSLGELWDKSSFCWVPIDDPSVIGTMDGEQVLSTLPDWLPQSARRAAHCDGSQGDLVISKTTARKMLEFIRSSSGYIRYMEQVPEQKKLSLQDQDFAAIDVQKICADTGIGFDEEVDCHHTGVFLGIRRTHKTI